MTELDKILKDNGISPAKKEQWNPAPNEILEDLFKTLGAIFGPQYDIDRKKNQDEADKNNQKS